MSHLYKVGWSIVDQYGNTVDNTVFKTEDDAKKVMATLVVADSNIILSVKESKRIIF